MKTETLEALAALLNANRGGSGNVHFDALTELAVLAFGDGSLNWSNENGYTVPRPEATTPGPVAPDLRTETLGRIVAVFEAFEDRKDDLFNERLLELGDYLVARGWLDDTDYVTLSTSTAVIPLDALELVAYVLNARANRAYLTLHDGLVRLSGYLVQTGFLVRSKDASYSIPETEAPEPWIIPFVPKD
jgi:hypothetical protein